MLGICCMFWLGDHKLAEQLNEQLAKAIAARETLNALKAREYALTKKADEDRAQNKKKQRLAWTYVHNSISHTHTPTHTYAYSHIHTQRAKGASTRSRRGQRGPRAE